MSRQKQPKSILFSCRSKEHSEKSKGKTWSRGTNSRFPFAVNVTLNLSNDSGTIVELSSNKSDNEKQFLLGKKKCTSHKKGNKYFA